MTCKKCGAALSPNANFCHHCGEKQEAPSWQQPMYGQATQQTGDGAQTPPGCGAQSAAAPDGAQPFDRSPSSASLNPPPAALGSGPVPQQPPQYQYNPYYNPYSRVSPNDAPHIGYAILCFFFPIVGLILYLVWKDEFPQRAKSAGKGALIGVITSVVLSILFVIIWFGLIFWLVESAWYY